MCILLKLLKLKLLNFIKILLKLLNLKDTSTSNVGKAMVVLMFLVMIPYETKNAQVKFIFTKNKNNFQLHLILHATIYKAAFRTKTI